LRPRVERRRRGPDFLNNFREALKPALNGEVDCVVHGGDLLYRSKVPATLVQIALQPMMEVAEQKIPVFLVPGNHERSKIPFRLLASHPYLHIFDKPRSFSLETDQGQLVLAGFPYVPDDIRSNFPSVLEATGWREVMGGARVVCIHHCVEGATVGPSDYTFRHAKDVIKCDDLPTDFCAVLSGHIHRHQVLTSSLRGDPLVTPVLYPGSVERTSFAERSETKGYYILEVSADEEGRGQLEGWRFHSLPARPMIQLELSLSGLDESSCRKALKKELKGIPEDSVVRLEISGKPKTDDWCLLSTQSLRDLAPEMNITLHSKDRRSWPKGPN